MEYKFGNTVLLEIVECVRKGLTDGVDVSDLLRKIEVSVTPDDKVELSKRYLAEKGRTNAAI